MTEYFKIFFKKILGVIRARKNRITYLGYVYIGKNCNIKGGQNITIGDNVTIRPEVDIWCSGKLMIGSNTEIGQRMRISINNECRIGNNVLFSPNVYITDCDHKYTDIDIPVMKQGIIQNGQTICIKDNAYIGINSIVIGNVTIGKGSVIGANSVVTKDIPDYCVAVGSPAQVIKKYNAYTGKWEKVTSK